ncbi:MAG: MFS transporter [Anaerolineales bacterium]
MRFPSLSFAPAEASPKQKRNFALVQLDAVGVGLASAAAPFLPVFLARLGASDLQVGLLTSMPAITGLVLGIAAGHFLQQQRNITHWYSLTRMLSVMGYAATGVLPFVVPRESLVLAVLGVWAIVTLPTTVVNVAFNVVMNAVAGPRGRYDLLSRRWSILGLTTTLGIAGVGGLLDRIGFPFDYQLAFLLLSIGGLVSYYFCQRIELEEQPRASSPAERTSLRNRLRNLYSLVVQERAFVEFNARRFVFLCGVALATPLFPLYYVRSVQASDAWIGVINTAQSAVLFVAYLYWAGQSRRRGSRFVLLVTSLALAVYPALTAMTVNVALVAAYAGLSGVFQAGQDLVFFDELMSTVPLEQAATFVGVAQTLQYVALIVGPMAGTALAEWIGIGGGLWVSTGVRLAGVGFLALGGWRGSSGAPAPATKKG